MIARIVVAAMVAAAPAYASLTLTVDSTDDLVDAAPGDGRCVASNGRCTLRAAVQEANASRGADTIMLGADSYWLAIPGENEDAAATGDLDLTDDVTLRGQGPQRSSIDGRSLDGVLHVGPGVRAEIEALTISGGLARTRGGGGIFNQGALHVTDSAISNNIAAQSGGGGLYNAGTARLERTSLEANSRTAITSDGPLTLVHTLLRFNGPVLGIASNEGGVTIVDSEIADQTGSALFAQGATHIERTRIHGTRPGWAVLIASGDITVLDSVIEENEGGGINNDGALHIERSTLRANSAAQGVVGSGGAAGVAGGTPQTAVTNTDWARIIASSILDHRNGGLVNEQGSMELINVTVSGNTSATGGGAISNNGHLEIRSSTITANASTASGGSGGITTIPDAINIVRISNSILAGNVGNNGASPNCAGTIVSDGYNLFGLNVGCTLESAASDRVDTNPDLAPLADNGGPTLMHALLPTSPAIDAGNPAAPGRSATACPLRDQRGTGRPQGEGCDIGAFEVAEHCGDGVVDGGEECDDGNSTAGDCCSPLCGREQIAGDCDANGVVDISELVRAVDLALTSSTAAECSAADSDGDFAIAIGDLIDAVRASLNGCED